MRGPDTVDGMAPAGEWAHWWQAAVAAKRRGAPWLADTPQAATPEAA
jgi:hypothetical protein